MPALKTSRFGEIDYGGDDIIKFVKPILGFNHRTRYILISRPESEPFKWLQSIEQPDICFAIIDPRLIVTDYTARVSAHDMKLLEGSDRQTDYQLFVIVTIPPGQPEAMSVNLQGPIVINMKSLTALQMVLNNPDYDTRLSPFRPEQPARTE